MHPAAREAPTSKSRSTTLPMTLRWPPRSNHKGCMFKIWLAISELKKPLADDAKVQLLTKIKLSLTLTWINENIHKQNGICILIKSVNLFKEYLHSQECIHGNVGARSVLVSGDLTAKLWGLGSVYRRRTQVISPGSTESIQLRKWQAPEVLSKKAFSHSSDVYVYSALVLGN